MMIATTHPAPTPLFASSAGGELISNDGPAPDDLADGLESGADGDDDSDLDTSTGSDKNDTDPDAQSG